MQKLIKIPLVQPSSTKLEVDKTLIWKGSTFTLKCTVEGYPPPERPTLQKGQAHIAFTCDGGTNKKFCYKTVTNVWYGDTDEYKCSTKNTISGTDQPSSDIVKVVISKLKFSGDLLSTDTANMLLKTKYFRAVAFLFVISIPIFRRSQTIFIRITHPLC